MSKTDHKIPAFVIAAPKSNSGKTLVTLGLIHAFAKRDMRVQPFKCGPDYIDPMFHSLMAKQPSYNLDTWMAAPNHVQAVFNKHIVNADVAVVEGAMGLFDGANRDEGSAASVARLLNIPVVLVVDASAMAYSMAALLYGYVNFDKRLRVTGVIFNKVSGESHYAFLKEAAADVGLLSLGYLPNDERLTIKSRHLGLVMPDGEVPEIVDCAATLIEKHIDIEALLNLTSTSFTPSVDAVFKPTKLRFAVAKDEAFNFSYQANIDRLNELGEVIYFSPLNDTNMPEADLVWLPGGYPELHLQTLSENRSMHQSIRNHIRRDKAVIAECGGMIYLGRAIIDKDGTSYPMVDMFDFETTFAAMKLHLGYRRIEVNGTTFLGHEFHYSNFTAISDKVIKANVLSARGVEVDMPIFSDKNVWASYAHIYLGEMEKMRLFLNELGLDIND